MSSVNRYAKYQSSNQWRWRAVAASNRIVADSAESYWNEADCDRGIELVKADQVTYYKYRDRAQDWRWRAQAANSRIIADSGEGYRNESDCDNGIRLMRSSANWPVYRQTG